VTLTKLEEKRDTIFFLMPSFQLLVKRRVKHVKINTYVCPRNMYSRRTGGVDVYVLLNLGTESDASSTPSPSRSITAKDTRFLWKNRMYGPQGQSEWV
jgi:hypothetical protein